MPARTGRGWTSVQVRLTALTVAVTTLAVLALVLSRSSETRRTDAFLAADAREDGELLDRALELEGGSLAVFASDYSYWDEMVRFVQTGDRYWATENIDDVLTTYRANAAWVFDAAGSPVYAVRDSTLETLNEPVPPGLSVKDAFGNSHFCHFFIAGPDGPIEVRGATIHPTADDDRKTPVRGYFLVARSWNRQYLAGLARLTGKTMRIEPTRDEAKPAVEIVKSSGEIRFMRPLPGPQGKPEMMLTASFLPDWIAVARRSGRGQFARQTVLALLAVLGLTLVLWFWVTRPLGWIRRSLESGSTEALKPLERNRTEFGQLAQLVGQFFSQNAALVREVTEREQAEVALRESERRHRETVDALPEAVFETGPDGRLTLVNQAGMAAFGLDEAGISRGVNALQMLVPEDRERAAADIRRVMGGDSQLSTDYTALRKDGSRFPAIIHADRIIRDGQPVGLRGILVDISARKQAEAALRESEERFRGIFDAARDGMALADVETGRVVTANGAFCNMLGYAPEEIARLSVPDFYPSESLAAVKEAYEMQAAGRTSLSPDLPMKRRDGSVFYVDVNSAAVSLGGRNLLIGIFRDITERKRAEEALLAKEDELKRSNAELEQFAYVASHDLQEPLRMVASYTQLLARRYKGKLNAEADEFIQYVNGGVTRMQRLINDLLTYSRVGRRGREFAPTECEAVLNRVLANLQLAIEDNKAEVTHDPLPRVQADELQLEQLLQNLIGNAIKYHGDSPPRVHISAERSNGSWMFSVRDNGIGIDPQYADRIFVIFQRLHSREQYEGTGIGLAVCKKIVERHGGRIWVESEIAKGATFRFTLPAKGE